MKREPLRIRLARTHTIPELEAMITAIEQDPDSKIGASGHNLYGPKALKKMDEISWAIYSIAKRNKPEYAPKASAPQIKNW